MRHTRARLPKIFKSKGENETNTTTKADNLNESEESINSFEDLRQDSALGQSRSDIRPIEHEHASLFQYKAEILATTDGQRMNASSDWRGTFLSALVCE